MRFDIIAPMQHVAVIAAGMSVRARAMLRRSYGTGRWRKMKGTTTVRLPNGAVRRVEVHWFEAHGIGRRDYKIKRYVDNP